MYRTMNQAERYTPFVLQEGVVPTFAMSRHQSRRKSRFYCMMNDLVNACGIVVGGLGSWAANLLTVPIRIFRER